MKSTTLSIALGCLLLAAVAGQSYAGFDVDFGASVRLGDDTDLYVAISSRYFERDRVTIEHWGGRYKNPDDLAVALFVSKHSGASLSMIFDLRRQRLSWWEISIRVGVPTDVWFVPMERDPGPPYGKAYGYWKKHRRNPVALQLTDADASNFVAVRMIHEYYSVPVEVAMEWRSSGSSLRALMSREYERRHGNGRPKAGARKVHTSPGHDKAKGKGR